MKRFLVLFIAMAVAGSAIAGNIDKTKEVKTQKPKKEYRYGKRGYFGNASFTFSDFGAFLDGEGWLIDKPHYGLDSTATRSIHISTWVSVLVPTSSRATTRRSSLYLCLSMAICATTFWIAE